MKAYADDRNIWIVTGNGDEGISPKEALELMRSIQDALFFYCTLTGKPIYEPECK